MQNFNLHTHTTRCFHAVGSDEEYVLAAIKNGIKILGFSDHCPMDQYTVYKDRMKLDELDEFLRNSCQVCVVREVEELSAVGEYLAVHDPEVTLRDWNKGKRDLPILYMEGDRMKLAYP